MFLHQVGAGLSGPRWISRSTEVEACSTGCPYRMRRTFPRASPEGCTWFSDERRNSSLHRAAAMGSRYVGLGLIGVVQVREVTEVVVGVTT